MEIERREPPRVFRVGADGEIAISHCADIALDPDEQVSFVTATGTEFDVVRKSWGYYATPSTNSRLNAHGLRATLVHDPRTDRAYLLLVERGRESEFDSYLDADGLQVLCWLDTDDAVEDLRRRFDSRR